MTEIPEIIEKYRDGKWRRDETRRIKTASDVEEFVEDLGFCLGLTDSRTNFPSIYVAVCGRRDVYAPKNFQKDPETSLAWVLKDEIISRGLVYYSKLVKGKAMFLAPRLIPFFNTLYGVSKRSEKTELSPDAVKILKVLRREWESSTSDLRDDTGIGDRKSLTRAIEELQKCLKVVPYEVIYQPKFTYLWTLTEARFPEQMSRGATRDDAVLEIARAYLSVCGLTQKGELSRTFGVKRKEAGEANQKLVDEGFAERIEKGVYILKTLSSSFR